MSQAFIVVGLGFGDEGKGTIVDALVAKTGARLVVRFSGGAQAAHNVIADDGRHHTFAQFGSGTFRPGCQTYLSEFMSFDPMALWAEAYNLQSLDERDCLKRLFICENAPLVTPVHKFLNRLTESQRGDGRHGSCGMGIGVAREMRENGCSYLTAMDMGNRRKVREHLRETAATARRSLVHGELERFPHLAVLLQSDVADQFTAACYDAHQMANVVAPDWLNERLAQDGTVVFEGSQGILLDEDWGFHPHTTWSKTTTANAETLLAGSERQVVRIGVSRTYLTRHGAGPFPSEGHVEGAAEPHNGVGDYQGAFRHGALDAGLLRYAAQVQAHLGFPLHGLALTHLDQTQPRMVETQLPKPSETDPTDLKVREMLTRSLFAASPNLFPASVSDVAGLPLLVESHGPRFGDKRWIELRR